MNATEQRQRHTAVNELRDEVGTVVDATMRAVAQQLEHERAEWDKKFALIADTVGRAVGQEHERNAQRGGQDISKAMIADLTKSLRAAVDNFTSRIGALEAAMNAAKKALTKTEAQTQQQLAHLEARLDAEVSRTLWGRLRWLVTGR